MNDEKNEGSAPRPFPWRFPNDRRAERGHTTPGRRAARMRSAPSRTCVSGIVSEPKGEQAIVDEVSAFVLADDLLVEELPKGDGDAAGRPEGMGREESPGRGLRGVSLARDCAEEPDRARGILLEEPREVVGVFADEFDDGPTGALEIARHGAAAEQPVERGLHVPGHAIEGVVDPVERLRGEGASVFPEKP